MLIRALILAIAVIFPAGIARSLDFDYTLILLEGDPAPPSVGGTYKNFYTSTQTSDVGEWALFAQLNGASTDTAIFRFSEAATDLVVAVGDTAPGTGGGIFENLLGAEINGGGNIVFRGFGDPAGNYFRGVFLASKGGGIAPLVLGGETAPGTGGAVFESFEGFSINSAGDVVFGAIVRLSADEVWRGIFLISEGVISALVQEGDTAPGTGGGSFGIFYSSPWINESREVVFSAEIRNSATTRGIFAQLALGIRAVAVSGGTAPAPGGGTFVRFDGGPRINASGQVAFVATIGGTPGAGLFVDSAGSLREVARVGDTAPGAPGAYQQIWSPFLNDAGDLSFSASLDAETYTRGSFAELGGVVTPVVIIHSTPAPGGGVFSYPNGALITELGYLQFSSVTSETTPLFGLYTANPAAAAVPLLSPGGLSLCVLSLLAVAGAVLRNSRIGNASCVFGNVASG